MKYRSRPISETGQEAPSSVPHLRERASASRRREQNPRDSESRPCNHAGGSLALRHQSKSSRHAKPKAWKRPAPRRTRHVSLEDLARTHSRFYSYPAEVIAGWCVATVRTAADWKSGASKPSRAQEKLFALHAAEKVLDARYWNGWIVRRGVLVDPESNECSQSLLRAYPMIVQYCRRLAYESTDPEVSAMFEQMVRYA
jgi:hypothetical protein